MEQENVLVNALNKVFICLVIIIALLSMNLIYNVSSSTSSNVTQEDENGSSDGYIDGMKSVNASEALVLFDSEDAQVIYFGRPDCGACQTFLPTLIEAQEKLEFTTNYVNINEISNDSKLASLLEKMDVETTVLIDGEEKKGEFGEFYGVTPTVIIVKDGKMLNGVVGVQSYKDYISFLNKNGIK